MKRVRLLTEFLDYPKWASPWLPDGQADVLVAGGRAEPFGDGLPTPDAAGVADAEEPDVEAATPAEDDDDPDAGAVAEDAPAADHGADGPNSTPTTPTVPPPARPRPSRRP